jgi:predicted ArsR family transcriptional regulator
MVMCAWGLRQTVEKAREAALTRMNDQLLEVQGTAKSDEMLEKQIKTMIEQVQKLRTGAFSPLSRQPLVRAILGLASAISGIALLEYASVANI